MISWNELGIIKQLCTRLYTRVKLCALSSMDAPVTVDSETVTVNFDLASVDDDVSFNERQMNVQSFGIAGKRSCQIVCCDA